MANQTIKRAKAGKKITSRFRIGHNKFSSIYPTKFVRKGDITFLRTSYTVNTQAEVIEVATTLTNEKLAGSKPFILPDTFLRRAEEMSRFMDKNPLSK